MHLNVAFPVMFCRIQAALQANCWKHMRMDPSLPSLGNSNATDATWSWRPGAATASGSAADVDGGLQCAGLGWTCPFSQAPGVICAMRPMLPCGPTRLPCGPTRCSLCYRDRVIDSSTVLFFHTKNRNRGPFWDDLEVLRFRLHRYY